MDVLRRIARSQWISARQAGSRAARVGLLRGALGAALIWSASGCAEWLSDFSPGDLWDNMTPSKETWEKMSPSNMWHSLQPSQLQHLNRGPGMSTDVYYSVPDPIGDDVFGESDRDRDDRTTNRPPH